MRPGGAWAGCDPATLTLPRETEFHGPEQDYLFGANGAIFILARRGESL